MAKYDKTEIQNKVKELGKEQKWNHCMELPCDIKTAPDDQVSHGKNIVKWSRIKQYVDVIDIKGKRVLDIGCNEGFFSLKLKELEAGEVIGIDADELRIKKAKFVKEILKVSDISFEVMDIYDDSIEKYGHFYFTLCLGFLHRVPYPYKALQRLSKISDILLLEWKSLKESSYDLPLMKFCGGISKDLNEYSSLYWLPSTNCVVDILKSLGHTYYLVIDNSSWRRTIVISSKQYNPIFENKDLVSNSKFPLLKRVTGSYIRNIARILRDKNIKWL